MKTFYSFIAILLLSIVFFTQSVLAQLTGSKTIPGDYATISSAITALNSAGVGAGGVIFNIAAGYNETITTRLSITSTGTLANQITFQKSGAGTNPLITAYTTGTSTPVSDIQDGIWDLIGSDYVTIDGIDLYDPNTSNPATMEYGYGMFKASPNNGCQYNTIQNCVVTLNRDNCASGGTLAVDGSRAINVVNALVTAQITVVVPASALGTNSYNKFYSNTLQNCNIGIALIGYAGANPFTLCDFGNDIGGSSLSTGNNIINYGGGVSATNPAAGVRTLAQYDLNVSYNTVNNDNGSGVKHESTLRGIYLKTALSASATISYNNLSISSGATTSQVAVIENASGGTDAGNTININNNNINNCNWTTATTGDFYGIWNNSATPANLNINNNSFSTIARPGTGVAYLISVTGTIGTALSISNNTFTNLSLATTNNVFLIHNNNLTNNMTISNNTISGTFAKTGAGGTLYGYYNAQTSTGGTATLNGNNFSNITVTGATQFNGIHNISTSQIHTITNNTISNITGGTSSLTGIYQGRGADGSTINGNTMSGWSGSGFMYGLSVGNSTAPVSLTVYNNTITGLSTNSSNYVYGIYNALGTSNSIFKNRIFNLESNTGSVYGIYVFNGETTNIYNNLISELKSPASNMTLAIAGIYLKDGITNNVYYNTVYLNTTSSGDNFSSACIYANTTTTVDMRNNIIVNTSTPKGGGYTAAYRRNGIDLTNYSANSNNNLFYAGTPGAKNVIFYDGSVAYQTLAAYKTLVGPTRDAASITELPPFVNVLTTPYNLHINQTLPTQCESGGIRITSPFAITTDYDGNIRWGEIGYTGAGSAPDIGADEFDSTITGNNIITSEIPCKYELYQNYPNPFNPSTKIRLDIIKNGIVKLVVYDITGRLIVTLVNGKLVAGKFEYTMTAGNLPSGVYFCKLETEGYTITRKMILLK